MLNRSTFEVLSAIKRLQARRGQVRNIFCDNELSFTNASKHIDSLYGELNPKNIQAGLASEGIDFHFNVPLASHKNGIVESVVKVCKAILKRKLSRAKITTRGLYNLSIEAEAILNNRPITTVTADQQERIVCPNELVIGKASSVFPEYKSNRNYQIEGLNTKPDIIRYLKYQDMLRKQILVQFYNDYVLTLQKYHARTTNTRALKISDIVLINDPKLMT